MLAARRMIRLHAAHSAVKSCPPAFPAAPRHRLPVSMTSFRRSSTACSRKEEKREDDPVDGSRELSLVRLDVLKEWAASSQLSM